MNEVQFNVLKVVGEAFLTHGSSIKNFSFEKKVLENLNKGMPVYHVVLFDKQTFQTMIVSLQMHGLIEYIDALANYKNLFVCSANKLLDGELILYYQTEDNKRLDKLEEAISKRIEVLRNQIEKSEQKLINL